MGSNAHNGKLGREGNNYACIRWCLGWISRIVDINSSIRTLVDILEVDISLREKSFQVSKIQLVKVLQG